MAGESQDSKAWALKKLQEANTILEIDQVPWRVHLIDFLAWSLECLLIWYLAWDFLAR